MRSTDKQVPVSSLTRPPEKLAPAALNLRWPYHMAPFHVGAKPANKYSIPVLHNAVMGSLAGMGATLFVHPLDVIKIRLQLFPSERTTFQMLKRTLQCEGMSAMYNGLTAGLLRQATYTTTRLAVYNVLFNMYKKEDNTLPSKKVRLWIAITAGIAGAFAGCPSEVALVRMTSEGRRRRSACSPPCSPICKKGRTPGGAFYVIYKMAKKEGILGIWRGAIPTLVRSMFVSVSQVTTYLEIRRHVKTLDSAMGNITLHVYTSIISSFVTALLSLPVDQVKTRYQAMKGSENIREVVMKIYTNKGVKYFWHGFYPYYVRLVLHTILTYVILDRLTTFYLEMKRVVNGDVSER